MTLDAFEAHLWPRPGVSGGGLTIRHRARTDLPPLVTIRHFTGDASWRGIFFSQLNAVNLDGLEVTIPPRRRRDMPVAHSIRHERWRRWRSVQRSRSPRSPPPTRGSASCRAIPRRIRVSSTSSRSKFSTSRCCALAVHGLADQSRARGLHRDRAGRSARGTGTNRARRRWTASSHSTPTSAPSRASPGALHSAGEFDGYHRSHRRVGQDRDARLSDPEAARRHALPLSTTFHAVVDGTNGDVQLDTVDARLAASRFVAKGFVVGTKGVKGKRILLDVTSEGRAHGGHPAAHGPHTPPAMSGAAVADHVVRPASGRGRRHRQAAAGRRRHDRRGTVRERCGPGQGGRAEPRGQRDGPGDGAVVDVPSTIRTRFTVNGRRTVRLQDLSYAVEGATVTMDGRYALESGALDFAGTVATRRLGVRDADRLPALPAEAIRRIVPEGRGRHAARHSTVAGTVDAPKVALDLGRTLQGT